LEYLYANDVFFKYENGTTGIKNLDLSGLLSKEKIVIPCDNLMDGFSKVTAIFMKNICNNARENNLLKETRDSLLPKLMSGEIRVTPSVTAVTAPSEREPGLA
jgi:type I restriction enzyme S subunit